MRSINLLVLGMLILTITVSAQDNASLYFKGKVSGTIESVEAQLRTELEKEKFGVITEIDMAKTLKEKVNADIMPYKILGVCNAGFAHEAILAEENIGVFLPCKVILKQVDSKTVEIVSINPSTMMKMIGNSQLDSTAEEVSVKLENVIT